MLKVGFLVSLLLVGYSLCGYAQGGLKDVIGKYALIGSSLNQYQSDGSDAAASAVVRQHFNTAVAENCMKAEVVQPKPNKFRFALADEFVTTVSRTV